MRRFVDIKHRAGFTVIELLVVIAVIAILAGILFPILGSAKETTKRAQCASNLRQLATAFVLYSQDYSGVWPCPGGLYGDKLYWSQTGSGGIESYVRQRGLKTIWCCPLLKSWNGDFAPRSYSMNSYLRNPPDGEYPTCLNIILGIDSTKITLPSRTILLYEGMPLQSAYAVSKDYIYRCANWSRVKGFRKNADCIDAEHPWHGRLSNYLYSDGHLVARPPGRNTAAELSTGREMYDWYVNKATYMITYRRDWKRIAPWD